MDDKIGDVEDRLPKLEDLCVKFIRANVIFWRPEDFLGIPKHLLFPLLEKLHPFEIEKLEVSGIFQSMGINTDPLWRDMYAARWPRQSKWPEVYFNRRGITQEQEWWRVYYLQRHLQEAVNGCNTVEKWSSFEGSQDVQQIISVCGKYASYLKLYNPAIVHLAKNWEICLQLAEYIEFLEVYHLRDNGVHSLCCLLQKLASKRLKSVGFWFCKVNIVEMWKNIISSFSPINHQPNVRLSDLEKNATVTHTADILTDKSDKSDLNVACKYLHQKQEGKMTSSKGMVQADDGVVENFPNISDHDVDDLDIYEFSDGSDNCTNIVPQHSPESSRGCDVCLCQSKISRTISSDLYDEVFGRCNCGLLSSEVPKELSAITEHQQQEDLTSVQCEIIPDSAETLQLSPFTSLSNVVYPLVHFELVGFCLHQDVLDLFLNSLHHCLNLESLILEDNGLGVTSMNPALSQKFTNTLFFVCTKGSLQSLRITNNLISDAAAAFLIEKLVASFCSNCNKNLKSLTKLEFSSCQVSTAFSASLSRVIRDVCTCTFWNQSGTPGISESATSISESRAGTKDVGQSGCTDSSCTHESFCVPPKNDFCVDSRKTKINNKFSSSEILESAPSKVAKTSGTDSTVCALEDCKTKLELQTGFNVLSNDNCSYKEEKRTQNTKSAFADRSKCVCDDTKRDSNNQHSIVGDCEEMSELSVRESSEEFSDRPLVFNGCATGYPIIGIQELHLSCPIWDQGASLIADGLQSNSSLHSLSLVNCDISTAGLADIFQVLSGNRFLKHLCVTGNSYDLGSNESLATMLITNSTLTELNLSSCKLGEHVAVLSRNFIHALCMNNTITCLKLEDNRLGDAHIAALSQVFSHPNHLSQITKLHLRNNHISLECLSALASSLQCIKPRKLDELELTGNFIGPETHQVLSSLRSVVHNVKANHLDKANLFADFISQM